MSPTGYTSIGERVEGDSMTPLECIEKIQEGLTALLQCPGGFVKITEILSDVRELKEHERLISEIF